MRVWIDVTNSPHVRVLPAARRTPRRARGHEVTITARDFAQTLELLEDCEPGAHGRRAAPRRSVARGQGARDGRAACGRFAALRAGGASTSRSPTPPTSSRSSRGRSAIPSAYAFDYEFAFAQHALGCRAATRVVVPEVIPQERLDRLGARAGKVRRYPGLKEEYYLHGFEPDPRVLDALGDRPFDASSSVVRTPRRSRSTTGTAIRCSRTCSTGSARDPAVQAVVLPRTEEQRRVDSRGRPSVARRPRARGRRAEPRRARRPRRLGRAGR